MATTAAATTSRRDSLIGLALALSRERDGWTRASAAAVAIAATVLEVASSAYFAQTVAKLT